MSTTKTIAKQIQAVTGQTLVAIHHAANQYMLMGLAATKEEALLVVLESVN